MKFAYAFSADGETCHEAHSGYQNEVPTASFKINHPDCVVVDFDAPQHPEAPREYLRLVDGVVVVDPAWSPPVPPADPLAELRRIVDQNILASEHDKRWLAQKEAAKRLGIPWIKANPTCVQAECEAALGSALATEFPGEPIVVSPAGVILSYAQGAASRGYIPAASWEALRDLVATTSEDGLAALLAQL